MTVSRLLNESTSAEIAGWMCFLELEDENRKQKEENEKKKKAQAGQELLRAKLDQAGKIAAAKKHGKRQV